MSMKYLVECETEYSSFSAVLLLDGLHLTPNSLQCNPG